MLTTVFNFAILAALAAADCSIGGSLAAIPSGGSPIHPNGNTNMCLDVQSNNQRDGTPVQVWECNGSAAQQWTFNRGSGQIKLTGTNYCIDASSYPGSGVKMKIWTCYAGIAAQAWYYTDDNRLAVEGQGQCLDLPSGGQWNGNVLQTWQCATGNNNQAWTYSSSAKRDLEGRDDCSSSGSGSNSGTGNSVTQPSGKASLMPNGNKAGLAGGTLFDQFQNHIGWWYDWTPNTLWHSGRPVAVPMLWGSGQRGDLQNDWSRWDTWMQLFSPWGSAATPQYMLGFNEPDCSSEASSNIDPYYAASLWNQYFAPLGAKGTVLVSPAMCMQDSETWLQPFRSAISTDFDVVSVHIYQGNLADVQRVVNHYRQYGKPLWITEFGCVNNPSSGFNGCTDQGQINSFIWQVVQWFEEQGDIMAYSPADVWGSNWVLNYGTWATETGNQYLSAVQHFHP